MGIDEETFLQHLNSLNIDTGGVSFSWLLEEDNAMLNWFYNNISLNNCLTPEERACFADLENNGNVLDEEVLCSEISNIEAVYDGIATPGGGQEGLWGAREKEGWLGEWVGLMEEQKQFRTSLAQENEEVSKCLSREKYALTEELSVHNAMLSRLCAECMALCESATQERYKGYHLMHQTLNICINSKSTEDKLFFSQLPLEEYYTNTELLATYMRHNLTRQMGFFNATQDNSTTTNTHTTERIDNDWKVAENKLTEVCDKLRDAIWCYGKSKAELAGNMEALKYIEGYDVSSCLDTNFEKVKYGGLVKILEKDLELLKTHKMVEDVHKKVELLSERLVLGEIQLRYEKTKYMYDKLCSLFSESCKALCEEELGVMCVKRDQVTAENLFKFALDFLNTTQNYVQGHQAREMKCRAPPTSCFLLQTLMTLLQCRPSPECDVDVCAASMGRTEAHIQRLEMEVFYTKFDAIKDALLESKSRCQPLRQLIWDGPTDQPNPCNPTIEEALYVARRENRVAEEEIKTVAKTYMEFKKIIEQDSVINNLWKWFLSDGNQIKLLKSKYQGSRPIKPFKSS